jgi:hypothetical protein
MADIMQLTSTRSLAYSISHLDWDEGGGYFKQHFSVKVKEKYLHYIFAINTFLYVVFKVN